MDQLEAQPQDSVAMVGERTDLIWMRRALSLANGVRGHVWPNPPVGCVILKHGNVIAEAATHPGGRPHAERKALDQAGAAAEGATLYVTLEPCCHYGNTPPCADAIIAAGVSRVVCAIQDPDPRVNGGGFAKLRSGGIEVLIGPGAEEAERLMSGFFHRLRRGEPELLLLDEATTKIPEGADALILSSQGDVRLFTNSGDSRQHMDAAGIPAQRILAHLAELGLTSVAVSREDPIAHHLSGLQDRP